MTDQRREPGGLSGGAPTRTSDLDRAAPRSPVEALQPETVPPPPQRSRVARHPAVVFLNFLLTAIIVTGVIVGGGLFAVRSQFGREGAVAQARSISVEQGSSLSTIAAKLQRDGLISSKWMFVAGVYLSREQSNLKAGEYLIDANASMRDIMAALVSGRGILFSVSIPEGLTTRQIVARLRTEATLEGEVGALPAEGSLLPETYKFSRGDSLQNLLDRMRRDHERVVADVWSRRAADLPITTPEELVVLASIVEKETALADERSRVAAVFINRLRINMRLQTDPTVVYGLFGGAGKPSDFTLSRADLESQTPYNTYVIDGLPPGPIANPGRASLEAVANPSRTRDLFFVADGSGGHAFAETYEDHLRNVVRWREIRDAAGK